MSGRTVVVPAWVIVCTMAGAGLLGIYAIRDQPTKTVTQTHTLTHTVTVTETPAPVTLTPSPAPTVTVHAGPRPVCSEAVGNMRNLMLTLDHQSGVFSTMRDALADFQTYIAAGESNLAFKAQQQIADASDASDNNFTTLNKNLTVIAAEMEECSS